MEARLVSAEMDKLVLDVDWSHDAGDGTTKGRRVAGDRRTITLREGERYLLDHVQGSPADREACGTVSSSVELEAVIESPAELLRQSVAYDMWLVHEDGRGGQQTQHRTATVLHGQPVALSFEPFRFPIDGTGCTHYAEIEESISGSLRGRIRDDALIDVVVRPHRSVTRVPPTVLEPGSEAGERRLTLRPGETVTLVLPNYGASGGSGLPCGDGSARPNAHLPPGVTAKGNLLDVDVGTVLAGHRTSIVLRAQRSQ